MKTLPLRDVLTLDWVRRDLDTNTHVHSDGGFDCRRCGVHCVPRPGQWIFYALCDACFYEFDQQKMNGRFSVLIPGQEREWYEDVMQWIAAHPIAK